MAKQNAMRDAALTLAGRGWAVFPAPADGSMMGCTSAEKSNGERWGATTDAAEIKKYFREFPRANVGIACGASSGIFVVEADTPEGHAHDGVAALRTLEAEHGALPATLMAESPSGGTHYFFKWPADGIVIRTVAGKIAPGIDQRGHAGMVIAAPSVRPGVGEYRWINDASVADAPKWLIALATADDRKPKANGHDSEPPPEWLRERAHSGRGTSDAAHDTQRADIERALKVIPADAEQVWFEIGVAIRQELGDAGRDLYHAWSATSLKYVKRECEAKWAAAANNRGFTANTIFFYADEADPSWRDEPGDAGDAAPANESGLGVWNAGDDTEMPPPRGWLLGNVFCRGFVSSLLGSGGTGKTALRYAQALSLATGRKLTGEHVFQRARVLIVSLEDDDRELKRRIRAARLHHKITLADVNGWLFLCAPGRKGGKLMTTDARGRLVEGDLGAKITAEIIAHRIDLVMLDPFVKAHSVEENANSAIDDVMQVLTDLAADRDVAIDTPHHTSKGAGDPGNADKGRGASAMANALRLVNTATEMTTIEAAAFGIPEADRRLYLRIDSAKVNITRHSGAAQWFRLVGVAIGNATAIYPHGDNVQTVEPWWPPDTWAGVGDAQIDTILDEIDKGLADGNRYGDAPNLTDRAAWRVVKKNCPDKTEQQAREIIKAWIKGGRLVNREYQNPVTFKQVKGLYKQLPLR